MTSLVPKPGADQHFLHPSQGMGSGCTHAVTFRLLPSQRLAGWGLRGWGWHCCRHWTEPPSCLVSSAACCSQPCPGAPGMTGGLHLTVRVSLFCRHVWGSLKSGACGGRGGACAGQQGRGGSDAQGKEGPQGVFPPKALLFCPHPDQGDEQFRCSLCTGRIRDPPVIPDPAQPPFPPTYKGLRHACLLCHLHLQRVTGSLTGAELWTPLPGPLTRDGSL